MNLEQLSLDQLAALRDEIESVLADRVAARQKELAGEADRLAALVGQDERCGVPLWYRCNR